MVGFIAITIVNLGFLILNKPRRMALPSLSRSLPS